MLVNCTREGRLLQFGNIINFKSLKLSAVSLTFPSAFVCYKRASFKTIFYTGSNGTYFCLIELNFLPTFEHVFDGSLGI